MRKHVFMGAIAALALAGGCATQSENPSVASGGSCLGVADADAQVAALYAPGHITRVEPVYASDRPSLDLQPRVVTGASLYVPAEPGVHSAYLQRVLSCHAAGQGGAHPNDPLRAPGVESVAVRAVGPQLRVDITSRDRKAARGILERAEAMQQRVSVQQVASAGVIHGG